MAKCSLLFRKVFFYKKPNFGSNFCSYGPYLDPQNFFRRFHLYEMLDIFASYHCMQFQWKLMIQTQENGEKTHFGSNLMFLSKIWLFQSQDVIIMVSYHHVQNQEKVITKSRENFKSQMTLAFSYLQRVNLFKVFLMYVARGC